MDNEKNKNEIENIGDEANTTNKNKPLPKRNVTTVKRQIFGMMSGCFPGVNPLFEKMNDEHITTLLQQKEEDSKRNFNKMIVDRLTMILIAFLVVGLVIFLTNTIAKSNPGLYSEILKYSLSCLLSGAGGYGFGYSKGKKNSFDDED